MKTQPCSSIFRDLGDIRKEASGRPMRTSSISMALAFQNNQVVPHRLCFDMTAAMLGGYGKTAAEEGGVVAFQAASDKQAGD